MNDKTEERAPLVENAAVPQLLPINLAAVERDLLQQVVLQTNYSGEHCAVVTSSLTKIVSDIDETIEFNPEEYNLILWSVNDAQFKGDVLEIAASLKHNLVTAVVQPA